MLCRIISNDIVIIIIITIGPCRTMRRVRTHVMIYVFLTEFTRTCMVQENFSIFFCNYAQSPLLSLQRDLKPCQRRAKRRKERGEQKKRRTGRGEVFQGFLPEIVVSVMQICSGKAKPQKMKTNKHNNHTQECQIPVIQGSI